MLVEMDERQLREFLAGNGDRAKTSGDDPVDTRVVYFYTPFCGTCRLARYILQIALAALPNLTVASCNVNLMPQRAQEWKIASVPCLALVERGEPQKKIYAFHSVERLYYLLKPLANER
ncbi:hypothetical protein BSNK01_08210 [Bacillaceae bacterium]